MTDLWTLDHVSLGQRLRAVTLRIPPGVTAVLGPSGAGKTSLLNLLVGFEKAEAGSVAAHFEEGARGRAPSRADGAAKAGHVRPLYWVPQGEGLWPHLTVREHLQVFVNELPPDADELLAEFDLADRAGARPETLSQGERARLAVARALAADAAVLVMDEPLAHVDPARAGKYWDVLSRRIKEAGASLVFATHAPATVLAQAQQVICLRDGRVEYAGSVETLYHTPPTPELALCLGDANWFEPAEARLWLGRETDAPCCRRPEQITVTPATDGMLVVESARFHGSVAEATLRHEASGAVRRFWHRPARNGLAKGMRVRVEET